MFNRFFNGDASSATCHRRRAQRPAGRRLFVEGLESRRLLDNNPIVTVDTNFGSFQVELYPAAAPQTVANFLTYVNDGAYNGTIFHRSVPGSVEQTGGYVSPTATFSGSTSQFTPIVTNPPISSEYGIPNVLGTVAMALDSSDNEATSQWFVNMGNNTQSLSGYTVFGQIISGMSVPDAIQSLPVKNVDNGTFSQLPVSTSNQLVVISSITVDSIDGTVFTDLNGNGQFGSGDPTLAGRTVFVNRDGTGVPDANNPSTATNASGNYTFTGVPAGTYTVDEVLPANASLTTSTQTVTVASDETASGVNFGERPSISGTVFVDANNNLQFDAGETVVSGRTVFVNIDGSGVPDANNPSTTTNANGFYYFSNMAPGSYTVREVVPSGVALTTAASRTAVVQTGMTALGVNFGEQPPPLTNNQKYIVQLFHDLLDRPAEPTAVQYWANLLNGGQTRPQVALEIEQSSECLNNTVTGLFEFFLHRAPDPTALSAYSSFLSSGGTATQIEVALVSSPEYYQNRGGGTNQGFVNALYIDALHRAADPGALKAWSSLNLSQPAIRTGVVNAIFGSDEYLRDLVSLPGAPSATAGYVVYGWYQAYLGHTADSAAVASDLAALHAGTHTSVMVANLVGSQEFFNLAQSNVHTFG